MRAICVTVSSRSNANLRVGIRQNPVWKSTSHKNTAKHTIFNMMKVVASFLLTAMAASSVDAGQLRKCAKTESSSVEEMDLSNDQIWHGYLRDNLSNDQYDAIHRDLQEVLLVAVNDTTTEQTPEVPIVWLGTIETPSDEIVLPSDIPSMVPSDAPSMVPSDVPSMAPTVTFVDKQVAGSGSMLDLIEQDGRLNWFRIMVEKGQMEEMIHTDQDITMFAPTNAAFQAMDRNYFAKLLRTEYSLHVKEMIRYHVLRGAYPIAELMPGMTIETTHQFGTVEIALGETGNVEISSAEAINAKVVDWDVRATNGIIHFVDQVLLPSFVQTDALTFLEQASTNPDLELQGIQHSSFLAIVAAAGYESVLRNLDNDVGEYTLFLPTDDSISPELFDFLMDDTNSALREEFIKNHILQTVLNYRNLMFRTPVIYNSLQGGRLTVVRRVGIVVNGALSMSFSLMRCGVVYHMNQPLIPLSFPEQFQTSLMNADEQPEFSSLLEVADQAGQLGLEAESSEVLMLYADAAVLYDVPLDNGLTMFLPSVEKVFELNDRFRTRFLQAGYEIHSYSLAAYHMATGIKSASDIVSGSTLEMVAGGLITAFDGFDGVYVESSAYPAAMVQRSVDIPGVGVIHVVESALLPSWALRNVVSHLEAVDDEEETYTKFRQIIAAAGMEDMLAASNDITLLAPRDEAVPDDIFDFLMSNGNSALAMQVVGFHVLKEVVNYMSVKENHNGLQSIGTFQGSQQEISIEFDGLFIGQAMASTYGLTASSIIYGIDMLLIPDFVLDEIPRSMVSGPVMPSGQITEHEFPVTFMDLGLTSTMMESF